MTPTRSPAFELRVAALAGDGRVCARTHLCWARAPSSAALLDTLLRRALQARRRGLTLVVEEAPDALGPLLALAGIGEVLVGDHEGKVEVGEP